MTTFKCQCCGEDAEPQTSVHDAILGPICKDCNDGATEGRSILARNGVTGVYYGSCPDNGKGEP